MEYIACRFAIVLTDNTYKLKGGPPAYAVKPILISASITADFYQIKSDHMVKAICSGNCSRSSRFGIAVGLTIRTCKILSNPTGYLWTAIASPK